MTPDRIHITIEEKSSAFLMTITINEARVGRLTFTTFTDLLLFTGLLETGYNQINHFFPATTQLEIESNNIFLKELDNETE